MFILQQDINQNGELFKQNIIWFGNPIESLELEERKPDLVDHVSEIKWWATSKKWFCKFNFQLNEEDW